MSNAEVSQVIFDNIQDVDLPALRKAFFPSQWISVKSLLPNDYSEILVRLSILYPTRRISVYFDKKFMIDLEDVTKWVTHWHELPALPEDEK